MKAKAVQRVDRAVEAVLVHGAMSGGARILIYDPTTGAVTKTIFAGEGSRIIWLPMKDATP